jgi:putative transposase
LRRLQRQAARRRGPDRRTGPQPSQRWRRTQARIATLHIAVANARRDGLHQLTTRLASTYGTIVLEDLHVAGMLANRRLARHIAGVGMAELRHQITDKTSWSGGSLNLADRWYPSSTTCSGCGVVKTTLPLSPRTFRSEQTVNEPEGNHVRPAPRAQRVPPREDPHPTVRANPGSRKAAGQDTPSHVS